ncbi:PAS domain-containing sensor histidine kinase [Labilibacter marinus]|uniref:PAS domain-containing sensor histidine kinase n=1 Tax=Labilibacter marinus TaxID=1477105 RepID=UPI00082ECFA9|nr:PAS domain-containing sensor histidine kinase [Labilibacter marinus]
METKRKTYDELKKENIELQKALTKLQQEKDYKPQSPAFRQMVYESSYMPTVVMDAETKRYVDCNKAAVEIYGYSSLEETLKKTPLDVSAPIQYDGTPSHILAQKHDAQAMKEGSTIFEWLHQRPDGTQWDAEVHLLRFDIEDKTYLQFSLVDITERIKIRKELMISQSDLNSVMKNSAESIWSVNENYEIQYFNQTFFDGFKNGFNLEVQKGTKILQSIPEILAPIWKERYDRGLKGEAYTFTDEVPTEVGTAYVEVSVSPIVIHNEVKGVSMYSRDTTERKEYELQLAELNKMRELIMNNIPSFIFWKDLNSVYLGCNNKFAEAAGVDHPKEIVGKTDYDLAWKKEEADFFVQTDQRIMRTGMGEYKIEEPQLQADGKKAWLETNKVPLKDEDGNVFGILGTFEDITKRKELEMELVTAKEKAEESDQLKSAFLANMSHEIRTPMNGILGFAELLKSPNLSGDEQESFISIIEQSGNRMLNIINDLINISKIESGQMEIALTETNINKQIRFLHNFFLSEAKSKGITLECHCTLEDDEATIKTDKEKIYAVLTNLIKNAIKYTERGTITFGYKSKKDGLLFYVRDTGIGIPANKQKSVFDRFVRADSDNYATIEGSGLGLSITKGYIDMLGGDINMESKEGEGSCFYFTLPNKNYCTLRKKA